MHKRATAASADGVPQLGRIYEIPPRQGRAVHLARGQTLTIINSRGTQVCDFWAFSRVDRREYLSMEHLHASLSRITPMEGDTLVTNRRQPILVFLEDTSPGVHDTVIAACDPPRYRQLGIDGFHDSCAANLQMAMQAIGENTDEIPSPFNVWMNTPVRADGTIEWLPPVSKPGDWVRFRAEMDCIAVMSACPQDLIPINGQDAAPAELHFRVDAR
ncbi:MAG: urea carboxylase-associated family protein [Rhizobiales bacterium]|nr:urea carboxylase-associated family protein [Hyphomicrobiales bacterium]